MLEQPKVKNPLEVKPAPEVKKSTFERILTDYDRDYLERGLEALYEDFATVPEKDFPDLLVFLDTGARPLAAGVMPIVRKVAQDRGLEKPANRFLAGTSRPDDLQDIMSARESGDPDWKEGLINKEIAKIKDGLLKDIDYKNKKLRALLHQSTALDNEEIRSINSEIEMHQKELEETDSYVRSWYGKQVEEVDANAHALEKRLKEILADSKAKNVMILDDYLCDGLTLKQVQKAFQSLEKSTRPTVTFMSFFARNGSSKGFNFITGSRIWRIPPDQPRARAALDAWSLEGFKVLLPSQEYNEYQGFIYKHSPYDSDKEDERTKLSKSFIGVEKFPGQAIAKVSEERDAELMLQLRHEIRDIAQEILKQNQK